MVNGREERNGLKRRALLAGATLMASLLAFSYAIYRNTHPTRTDLTIELVDLPAAFEGYRIVHLSDIHNARFVSDEKPGSVLDITREADPDIIAITGDLVDRRSPDIGIAIDLADSLTDIAPVLFVTGNHERVRVGDAERPLFDELGPRLAATGTKIIDGRLHLVERGDERIVFAGAPDPYDDESFMDDLRAVAATAHVQADTRILLSHRPEHFELYASMGYDVSLTGHAHGGQVNLPAVGPILAPNQGFLPEHAEGVHSTEGLTKTHHMVVSRGIGNSILPLRINNDPEVIVITLRRSEAS